MPRLPDPQRRLVCAQARVRRRRWRLPVIAEASLAGNGERPVDVIARALPLPAFLCIVQPRSPRRVDAECVDVRTTRMFSVECGDTWVRISAPTHRPVARSVAYAEACAQRIARRFGGR